MDLVVEVVVESEHDKNKTDTGPSEQWNPCDCREKAAGNSEDTYHKLFSLQIVNIKANMLLEWNGDSREVF